MAREYHKIIPSVYLLFYQDGKILLLRRANTGHHDGMYSLPSGHVEAGESAVQAAIRETQEEIGIDVAPLNLSLVHVIYRAPGPNDNSETTERINLFFTVKYWRGQPMNNEPEKCDELLWCNLDTLPENIAGEVRQALKCVDDNQPYSDYGF